MCIYYNMLSFDLSGAGNGSSKGWHKCTRLSERTPGWESDSKNHRELREYKNDWNLVSPDLQIIWVNLERLQKSTCKAKNLLRVTCHLNLIQLYYILIYLICMGVYLCKVPRWDPDSKNRTELKEYNWNLISSDLQIIWLNLERLWKFACKDKNITKIR